MRERLERAHIDKFDLAVAVCVTRPNAAESRRPNLRDAAQIGMAESRHTDGNVEARQCQKLCNALDCAGDRSN